MFVDYLITAVHCPSLILRFNYKSLGLSLIIFPHLTLHPNI